MRHDRAATLRLALCCLMAGALAGCLGYRLGSSLPPDIHSVHVPAFVNQTGEPQIDVETTRATVQEFQKDGTLRVANEREADSALVVQLTAFTLEPLRYERDNARTTNEYRLRITARIVYTKKGATAPMVDKYVVGETTFEPGGDLSSSKVVALPAAARDLAHQIVKNVVEFWE